MGQAESSDEVALRKRVIRSREGNQDRIEWFMWDDVTLQKLYFFFKGLSPNRHRPLLDRVSSSEFELSQLCKFAKCLVLEEQ